MIAQTRLQQRVGIRLGSELLDNRAPEVASPLAEITTVAEQIALGRDESVICG